MRTLRTRATAFVTFASLVFTTGGAKPPGVKALEPQFQFIGAWIGPKAIGTVILISPTWAITATHVAKSRAENPALKIKIEFDNGEKVGVSDVFMADGVDVSLIHLSKSVNKVKPAVLFDRPLTKEDGVFLMTLAGHSGDLHCYPNRRCRAISEKHCRHLSSEADPNPGRAGDSGGAWALTDPKTKTPVVFVSLHGGGLGSQLSPLRGWIDDHVKTSREASKWQSCELQRPATTQPDDGKDDGKDDVKD